jgi:hypothetical protein
LVGCNIEGLSFTRPSIDRLLCVRACSDKDDQYAFFADLLYLPFLVLLEV